MPNSDVVVPWLNGSDVTGRPRDMFIVDFGTDNTADDAAAYEMPFGHVEEHVKPVRANNKRKAYRERWWLHVETRPAMRTSLRSLARFIATPTLTKHRLFVWLA